MTYQKKGQSPKSIKNLSNSTPKNQIIQLKLDRGHEQTFFQRHPDGQQTHEKMFNITHHQGNTNQNYNEKSPHISQNGYNQQHKKQYGWVRMWRKGNPLALIIGIQTGIITLQNSMEATQNVKNRITLQSSNCTTRYLPKGSKILIQRDACTPKFITAL